VFLVYALNFIYNFVDDAAIPYVFAQNIRHAKGLSYNGVEGRAEGCSAGSIVQMPKSRSPL
jgi:hypothetical protein